MRDRLWLCVPSSVLVQELYVSSDAHREAPDDNANDSVDKVGVSSDARRNWNHQVEVILNRFEKTNYFTR